jgi:hypothetical protein
MDPFSGVRFTASFRDNHRGAARVTITESSECAAPTAHVG